MNDNPISNASQKNPVAAAIRPALREVAQAMLNCGVEGFPRRDLASMPPW